jgi:ABC-type Fe3+/spermidine/putrescine transport system ATPase subunit
MDFLHLQGLGKRFGGFRALRGVDLEVREGEFLTLLGPSGSGKTTLLRIVAGFERPSSGTVSFRGRDLEALPPERRPFNTVFQSYALFPHMSVAENVAYGPRTAGAGPAEVEGRVRELLDLVHLQGLEARRVGELSGGQQQRVALARALINDPQVLLLDEPLGALDLQLRKHLQVELKAIQERVGTTFVHVTHDQEEALALSHRIAIFERGRLVQIGDPRAVHEHPATQFVAQFVGDTNLVACTVASRAGSEVEVRFANGARHSFRQPSAGEFFPGEEALAVLRPSYLELCEPGDGLFAGSVARTLFLGSRCCHDVVTADGQELRVDGGPDEPPPQGAPRGVRIRRRDRGAIVRPAEVAH